MKRALGKSSIEDMDAGLAKLAVKWDAAKCDAMADVYKRWIAQLRGHACELRRQSNSQQAQRGLRGSLLLAFELSPMLAETAGYLDSVESRCLAKRFEDWARELVAKAVFLEKLQGPERAFHQLN